MTTACRPNGGGYVSDCDGTEEMLTETCQLAERRQRTKERCPASRDRRKQEGNDDRRLGDAHACPRLPATQQQNAQNGRCQHGDGGGPPNDGGAGLAVHALRWRKKSSRDTLRLHLPIGPSLGRPPFRHPRAGGSSSYAVHCDALSRLLCLEPELLDRPLETNQLRLHQARYDRQQ